VGLYVRDIERSKAFYRDILGLKVSDENPKTGSTFMTAMRRPYSACVSPSGAT
jgi:catechol 2,3-dioxygenase-like lactoylglutathione lyase family enzyme